MEGIIDAVGTAVVSVIMVSGGLYFVGLLRKAQGKSGDEGKKQ